jgi:predicted porin
MASTGFNPNSGQLASATGSLAAQNGLNQKANYGQMANLGDGSRGGQAFNDQLYAGLASQSLGQLTVGRHRSFGIDMVGAYDPAGGSYAFSVIGYSGVMSGGGDTESARMDNSIKYKVDLGGVHVGALYKFADGAGGCLGGAGWTAATCAPVGARNDAYEFNAGFSYAGFDVDALGGHINQAVSAAALTSGQAAANAFNGVSITGANLVNPANSLAGTITDNTVAAIAAKYSWNQFKLFAGYEHILYQNPTNAMGVGANAQGGYILSAVTNGLGAGQNDKSLNVFWTGVKYAYDPKLDFTLSYYHYLQNQYASVANALTCANAVQSTRNGACNGTLDAVSFYADYHFNKRFDAYAGMMVSNVAGGLSSGYLNSTNFAPTAGVRYQF